MPVDRCSETASGTHLVVLLERGDFLRGEIDVDRGGSVAEVVGLRRADDRVGVGEEDVPDRVVGGALRLFAGGAGDAALGERL